jgi:hypothetical protein
MGVRFVFLLFVLTGMLFSGCDMLKKPPESQGELVETVKEGVAEFQELAKPSRVTAWVDKLAVKAQPGMDMPKIATMKEGEEAEYLYQRTVRKSDVTLRGQTFSDSWYLIRTGDSLVGWVHGGGIRFVELNIDEVFALNKKEEEPATRGLDPVARLPKAAEDPAKPDWTVIPGKRLGPVKENTSETMLIQLFGSGNVSRGEVSVAANKKEACTWLFDGTHEAAAVCWKDPSKRTNIKAVYLLKRNSRWHFPEGLKTGLSLQEVLKVNQAPLRFYGFDWEYGGTIESWKTGKLAPYKDHFYAVLAYDKAESPPQLVKGFRGESIFESGAPGLQELSLYIDRIVVYLD